MLKIDVEGAEVDVLKGAEMILRAENKPVILFESNGPALERVGHSSRELVQFLSDLGYEVFRITEDGRLAAQAPGSDEVGDFVALPRTTSTIILDALAVGVSSDALKAGSGSLPTHSTTAHRATEFDRFVIASNAQKSPDSL